MLPDVEERTYMNEGSVITLSDKIKFENVRRKYVCDPTNPNFITAEYVMDEEIRPSTCDWIGLFPQGWKTLDRFVAFECIIDRAYNEQERKWHVSVSLKFVKESLYDTEFQFVFVNSDLQVMGTSPYFRFYKCVADAAKALNLNGNIIKSEVSEAEITPIVQGSNKFAQVAEEDGYQEKFRCNPSPVCASISDDMLLVNLNGVYMSNCRNCERLPDILKLQHNLFQEIKNMAESKRDLQDYINTLEKKLEISMAMQLRLLKVAEYEKQERIIFQTIATTVLNETADGSTLNPIYSQVFNTCITAMAHAHQVYGLPYNKVRPGMWPPLPAVQGVSQSIHSPPNHYSIYNQYQRSRSSGSSSILSLNLKLKAIIGAQNEKLRTMSSKMAQALVTSKSGTSCTQDESSD